jgi:hypothetical protein
MRNHPYEVKPSDIVSNTPGKWRGVVPQASD